MSPAVEVVEPESGVNNACTLFSAVNLALEAEANCCCWSSRSSSTLSLTEVAPVSVTPSPYEVPLITTGSFSCQLGTSCV